MDPPFTIFVVGERMSSSEEEREAFEVTDRDLEGERDPTSFRRKPRSKDDAIYGVFGDSDSDDEDQGDKRRSARGPGRAPAFVSASTASGSKPPTKRKAKKRGSDDDDEYDDNANSDDDNASDDAVLRRGFGISGDEEEPDDPEINIEGEVPAPSGQRSARTFKPSTTSSSSKELPTNLHPARRTANPFVRPSAATPSAVNVEKPASPADEPTQRPAGQGLGFAKKDKPFAQRIVQSDPPPSDGTAKKVGYSLFQNKGVKKVDKDFAKFVQHGKGIGMKLLSQMGWTPGEGIGRHKQGIVAPIEVIVRPKNQAIQEKNERTKQSKEMFNEGNAEEEGEGEPGEQWRVSGSGKKQKPKYTYVEPKDLAPSTDPSSLKIVDMTAPSARTSSYGDLKQRGNLPVLSAIDPLLPMPELQHNMKVLVDTASGDLIQLTKKLHIEQDRVDAMQIEKDKTTRQIEVQDKHIARIRELLDRIDDCQTRVAQGDFDLSAAVELFATLQSSYPHEYRLYELSLLAFTVVFPLIEAIIGAWDIFARPADNVETFETWRTLLVDPQENNMRFDSIQGQHDVDSMNMYEQLCWNVLLPRVRVVIGQYWNPRDFDPLIRFVTEWQPALPAWIFANILQQLIFPRLQVEVDLWDPRVDIVPIHVWIHPWLPLLGNRLDALYPIIRYKLGACLQAWHPSDGSAKAMIAPWKEVFSKADMVMFVNRFVCPKLIQGMREFIINPANQSLSALQWLLSWRDLMGVTDLTDILEQHFFPKFIAVLCEWLSSPTVNLAEVSHWYSFWKKQFDAELLTTSIVRGNFSRALDLMNRAALGPDADEDELIRPPLETPLFPSNAQTAQPMYAQSPMPATQMASDPSVGLRDLVQKIADDNNILFIPKPVRTSDGKLLYNFGNALMYVDRGVVFLRPKGQANYRPVSMEELPTLAK